jgi:hypothetical protein
MTSDSAPLCFVSFGFGVKYEKLCYYMAFPASITKALGMNQKG